MCVCFQHVHMFYGKTGANTINLLNAVGLKREMESTSIYHFLPNSATTRTRTYIERLKTNRKSANITQCTRIIRN